MRSSELLRGIAGVVFITCSKAEGHHRSAGARRPRRPRPAPGGPAHLADHKDVGQPGGEAVARAVLDVHHVKGAGVTLPVGDHADTAQVSASGHHAHVT